MYAQDIIDQVETNEAMDYLTKHSDILDHLMKVVSKQRKIIEFETPYGAVVFEPKHVNV